MERKFHGKRLDNGEWIVGDLVKAVDCCDDDKEKCLIFAEAKLVKNCGCIDSCECPRAAVEYAVEVFPESVGQYITKDDFKNDIFEGSIIKDENAGGKIIIFVANDIRTFTREYDRAEHSSKWEVIGNWTDNPELLEDEL